MNKAMSFLLLTVLGIGALIFSYPYLYPTAFMGGGGEYNTVSLLITSGGTILGLGGLVLAIQQLTKIKQATEIAAEASKETRTKLSELTSLLDLTQLCHLSGELVQHLQSENVVIACTRAFDLRTALGRLRKSVAAHELGETEWQKLIADCADVWETLGRRAMPDIKTTSLCKRAAKKIANISDRLNSLAAELEFKIREK